MNKLLISESEKNEILNKHHFFQKVLTKRLNETRGFSDALILEQGGEVPKGDEIIKMAHGYTDAKTGARVAGVCKGLTANTFVIKQTANGLALRHQPSIDDAKNAPPRWVKDDIIYYYNNFTYVVYDGVGVRSQPVKWTIKGRYKWACPSLFTASNQLSDVGIQQFKKDGWLTYDEAIKQNSDGTYPINWSDKKSYKEEVFNGQKFYLPIKKTQDCPTGPTTTEEAEFVNAWTSKTNNDGYKYCGQIKANERENRSLWIRVTLPDSQSTDRPNGIIMYAPVSALTKSGKVITNRETESNVQGEVDVKTCKAQIKTYWNSFKTFGADTGSKPNPDSRMFVQKCVRQHYPFGGGVFSNIDEILNTLIRTKTEFEGFERPTTEQECWWIYPKNTPLTVVQKSIDKC